MVLCFRFQREYFPCQDVVAVDYLNADARRRQLIRGKNLKTGGQWTECVQRLDEAG